MRKSPLSNKALAAALAILNKQNAKPYMGRASELRADIHFLDLVEVAHIIDQEMGTGPKVKPA